MKRVFLLQLPNTRPSSAMLPLTFDLCLDIKSFCPISLGGLKVSRTERSRCCWITRISVIKLQHKPCGLLERSSWCLCFLPDSATCEMSTPCSAAMKPRIENTTKPEKKLVPLLMRAKTKASLQERSSTRPVYTQHVFLSPSHKLLNYWITKHHTRCRSLWTLTRFSGETTSTSDFC